MTTLMHRYKQDKISRETSSDTTSVKVLLKKRPRESDESFEQQKRHSFTSHLFGRGSRRAQHHFQQQEYSTPEFQQRSQQNLLKFENSADDLYPVGEYTEHPDQSCYSHLGSAPSSDMGSFSLNGTPISRTKRFNHNLQSWLNRFQYYSKKSPFHKLRSERNDLEFINENILSSPVEELPEDAFSCYNQYRTQNFRDIFDTLHIEKENKTPRSQNVEVPVFSPLNELTFEQLQEFKEQLFGIPPFSEGSSCDVGQESNFSLKITEVSDENYGNEQEDKDKSQSLTPVSESSAVSNTGTTLKCTYKSNPTTEEKSLNKVDVGDDTFKNDKELLSSFEASAIPQSEEPCPSLVYSYSPLDTNVNTALSSTTPLEQTPLGSTQLGSTPLNTIETASDPPLIESTESQLLDSAASQQTTPTPEIIKRLYDDSIATGEEYALDSSQFEKIDSLSIQEGVLTPLEPANSSVSLQRSRSVLQRVMSVFKGEHTINSDMQSNSSHSTYSPISVVVPALKQSHNIIGDIAGNISDGQPIEPFYHPEDFSSNSTDDENKPFDIKDPKSFQLSSDSAMTTAESPISAESRLSTIKFDKFAQLLLYDGSRRSKYYKVKHQFPPYNQHGLATIGGGRNRQDIYKNRGTLSLSPTYSPSSVSKLRSLSLSKFPKFGPNYSKVTIDDIVESFDDTSLDVRPILKSRRNKNESVESVRAKYCDEVEVEDFMDFFENHEKQRMESEPFLERVRERQLSTYYTSEDSSSPTTNDSTFDA